MHPDTPCRGDYPWTTPLIENAVWLAVLALGSLIFSLAGTWAAAAYLGYSVACMYLFLPWKVCTHCAYHGRTCHSGQGRIAGLLFAKADAAEFSRRFKLMRLAAPVFLAPLVAGLAICAVHFMWWRLAATLGFGILALAVTRAVTCGLGCPRCEQRAVCPAFQGSPPKRGVSRER